MVINLVTIKSEKVKVKVFFPFLLWVFGDISKLKCSLTHIHRQRLTEVTFIFLFISWTRMLKPAERFC